MGQGKQPPASLSRPADWSAPPAGWSAPPSGQHPSPPSGSQFGSQVGSQSGSPSQPGSDPTARPNGTPPARYLALDFGGVSNDLAPPPLGQPMFLPPPGDAADAASAAAGAGARRGRRRLTTRQRRIAEGLALLLLIPLTLTVQWVDRVRQIEVNLEPAEQINVVPRGRTGTLGHARWVMAGRVNKPLAKPDGEGLPNDATEITLSIGMKVLDPRGTKEAGSSNMKFRLVDRAGHQWSADADYEVDDFKQATAPPVGKIIPITVTAELPRRVINEVVLDVTQSGVHRPKGPVRILRFAH